MRRFLWVFFAVLLMLASGSSAHAQQAIISMPAADITPEGTFFVMHETQTRFWERPYWNTTHFLTYGVGHNTELAATLFNVGIPSTGNATLALGAKSYIPFFERELPRSELRLNLGAMALISLDNQGVGAWVYGLTSFRLPVLRTRLGAGFSYATPQLYEATALSVMLSIEQPIPGIRGLSLVGEWFSGSHDLSNLIVGLTYHPNPRWIFVLGWKVPTRDQHMHVNEQALVAEVGLFLPLPGRQLHDDDH